MLPQRDPALSTPGRMLLLLTALTLCLLLLGAAAGSDGLSLAFAADWPLISAIRLPRSVGALLCGALLGLSGAIAQGVFRNPLADPYLLGTAAGAVFAVVVVLAMVRGYGGDLALATLGVWQRLGLVGAAFVGALAGVMLTLTLSRGTARTTELLLAGMVVAMLMSALSELVLLAVPEALRDKQLFMLGSTAYLGWGAVGFLAMALLLTLPAALVLARGLDALALGEYTASSLGLNVAKLRLWLVALVALATAAAIAEAGLIGFVGLIAPHLVRSRLTTTHATLIALSSLMGAVVLLAADIAARTLVSPQELPVGLLTAVLGGGFLLYLLGRRQCLDKRSAPKA